MDKPILCLDFDGVLHSYTSGWKGVAAIPDAPTLGAMDFLRRVYEDGRFDVAIFSSRSKSLRGRWAMKRWLYDALNVEYGQMVGPTWDPLRLEIYEWVKWPWFKPPALIVIDDRAVTFTGTWPSLDALKAFKPWNKA